MRPWFVPAFQIDQAQPFLFALFVFRWWCCGGLVCVLVVCSSASNRTASSLTVLPHLPPLNSLKTKQKNQPKSLPHFSRPMKFLECPKLLALTNALSGANLGDRVVHGRIESYTCTSAACESVEAERGERKAKQAGRGAGGRENEINK